MLLLLVGAVSLTAQAATADEVQVLESFDQGANVRDWKVIGSQFSKAGFPKIALPDSSACEGLPTPEGESKPAVYPKELQKEDESANAGQRVLGVYAEFTQKGRNRIEVIPTAAGTKDNSPIYFNGVVEKIGLWVWGGNFDYDLDLCLKDCNGNIHRLDVCKLNFIGWKYVEVSIPHFIPQVRKTVPALTPLQFVKFIVTSEKAESNKGFFLYFDQITYTVLHEQESFNGNVFINPQVINKIWGQEAATAAEGK